MAMLLLPGQRRDRRSGDRKRGKLGQIADMSKSACDVVVIGAGVVGLATARAFALADREVIVLERARAIGTGTSSRNSEVIHSGIYYPTGSLKALACVEGREKLYAYCVDRGIPHRRCGKLVVLSQGQSIRHLQDLERTARRNGVADVVVLDRAEVARLEPSLQTDGALLCPSTGILDSHAFMLSLRGDIENAGGLVVLDATVESGDVRDGLTVRVGGAEPAEITARSLVNCAGLAAIGLPGLFSGFPSAHLRSASYAKGSYFSLSAAPPFSRLVYPLPEPGGLGVHATLDLGGRVRFGPDVEWVADPSDLDVDPGRAAHFYVAIRRYWPGLPDGALQADYAGIRPKLSGRGEVPTDFLLQGESIHGIPGLTNVLGIESPGLTASLALADRIVEAAG